MISIEGFFGGAHSQSLPALPALLTLNTRRARFWRLRYGAPGASVVLPDFEDPLWTYGLGPTVLVVYNDGGTHAFDLVDHNAVLVQTVAAGEVYELGLCCTGTHPTTDRSAWYWDVRKRLKRS